MADSRDTTQTPAQIMDMEAHSSLQNLLTGLRQRIGKITDNESLHIGVFFISRGPRPILFIVCILPMGKTRQTENFQTIIHENNSVACFNNACYKLQYVGIQGNNL